MLDFAWWAPIHLWFVKWRLSILWWFSVLQWSIVLVIATSVLWYGLQPSILVMLFLIGKKLGVVAVWVYMVTLVPGMLRRFRVLPQMQASLMLFRRQLGIVVFLLSCAHSLWVRTLPDLVTGSLDPSMLVLFEIFGVVTLTLLFPLWLTSNDVAQKKLGKWWKRLHRLTYIALFFVFLHVSFQDDLLGFFLGSVLALELLSWIWHWLTGAKPKSQREVAPS